MIRPAALCLLLALPVHAQDAPGPFASYDGATEAVLNDPHDLTIGPDGLLYVADKLAGEVAVFDPETLELVTRHGGGYLPQVRDVSFAPDGRVAVSVTGLGAVLVYADAAGLAGDPVAVVRAPGAEGGLLHSNGRVYVVAAGQLIGVRPGEDGDVLFGGLHPGAHDVAEGPDGSVWVADNARGRLVRYDAELTQTQVIEGLDYRFRGPRYMAFDEGGRIVVADQESHRVLLIDPEAGPAGVLVGVLGTGEPGMGPDLFDDPEGVAVDGNRYFVSDSDNNRVVRYTVVTN